jgi:transcriptional regulator with XRE-family HTH domain
MCAVAHCPYLMEIAKLTDAAADILPDLKEWMAQADLTHEDVAEIAGCSRPVITRTLQGKLPLSADRAARIAAVSGIPIERLVTNPETARILKLLGKRSTSYGRKLR